MRLDERQRELVDVAMGSARALLAVIGDVLDFSKIEAGFLDLAPVTVAVGPLVSEVVGQHRHAARLRGLELTVTLDPALGAAHVVDAGRLRQVLGNLLGNAMKFTREGGVAVDVTVLEGGRRTGAGTQRVALAVATPASASRRRTSGACSSRSPRPAPTTRAAARARGWAWRSAGSWSRRWAGRSRCAARRGRGRR